MAKEKEKINAVDLLLSQLDKEQLANFIRKECSNNRQFEDRFLALGVGTLFRPDPEIYVTRVEDLIEKYGGRYGHIEYSDISDFCDAVSDILSEATDAMRSRQWEVAMAVLTGISSVANDILTCGDDYDGVLEEIVGDCFADWSGLCMEEQLPEDIRSEIFELALSRFNDKDLNRWYWWWHWLDMAIELADTPERQNRVFEALDAIQANVDGGSGWCNIDNIQNRRLEMISKCGNQQDQIRFMYDNVAYSDFRERLIRMAWNKGDYDEVLRLAAEGEIQDSQSYGSDWKKWQYLVYRETGDRDKQLQLAKEFFLKRGCYGDGEFSREAMYDVLKSLIPQEEWPEYVESLIKEVSSDRVSDILLFIYIKEEKWAEYMEYLRQNPSTFRIDCAPAEVKEKFRDDIIALYASEVNAYFRRANCRSSYRNAVKQLRTLIEYGGEKEAQQIVADQMSRYPRRPALIDELSKL